MEKTLSKLFDYQKFEGNSRLDKMIAETEARYDFGEAISDEDLSMISAAGDPAPTGEAAGIMIRTPIN